MRVRNSSSMTCAGTVTAAAAAKSNTLAAVVVTDFDQNVIAGGDLSGGKRYGIFQGNSDGTGRNRLNFGLVGKDAQLSFTNGRRRAYGTVNRTAYRQQRELIINELYGRLVRISKCPILAIGRLPCEKAVHGLNSLATAPESRISRRCRTRRQEHRKNLFLGDYELL